MTPLYGQAVSVSTGTRCVEVHGSAIEVVAGRQPGLEDHDRRGRLGQDGALELDPHPPRRAERVDAHVRAARMHVDLLVLLEPGVGGAHAKRRCVTGERVVAKDRSRPSVAPGTPARRPTRRVSPCGGSAHGPRRRAYSSTSSGGRSTAGTSATPRRSGRPMVSKNSLAAEEGPDASRHWLDVTGGDDHLRVVAHGMTLPPTTARGRPGPVRRWPRPRSARPSVAHMTYRVSRPRPLPGPGGVRRTPDRGRLRWRASRPARTPRSP